MDELKRRTATIVNVSTGKSLISAAGKYIDVKKKGKERKNVQHYQTGPD